MEIKIRRYTTKDETKYNEFLLQQESSLFYSSVEYKSLLESNLNCESNYLLAFHGESIIGAFPLIASLNDKYGSVINSLPFYGSNSGILVSESLAEDDKNILRKALLDAAISYSKKINCVAYTFITNPLDKGQDNWFKTNVKYDFLDKRIGQITKLPNFCDDYGNVLIKIFENPRPRNIRKAIKSDIKIYCSNSAEDMTFLYKVHKENIESIGGLAKNKRFFESVSILIGDNQYKIYIAEKDGVKIAALLLLYFNKTVEYFTPATLGMYRNMQPSSLLIFEAMKDAAKQGYKYWNWGGTWLSQDGVYNFKKKWGAEDCPYFYYTNIFDVELMKLSKEVLLERYPLFFVLPFSHLKS